ncbi:hypothetical protein KBC31_02865 [Candidatus Saccharibacteria bacterium]|nr:hypothetical protein [Candidatus Saccharibacteria bacterium]
MGIFGLGDDNAKKIAVKDGDAKSTSKQADTKATKAKMEAKKEAGGCEFC